MPASECYPITHTTNNRAVGQCGGIAIFDAASHIWEEIPSHYETKYALTDTALVGLVPLDGFHMKLIEFPLP